MTRTQKNHVERLHILTEAATNIIADVTQSRSYVAFAREFLHNTGQFTGQDAPRKLVMVRRDDGHAGNVLDCNLWPVDRLHLEP